MKFLDLLLENGSRVRVNRDMIKLMVPSEDKLGSQIDLIGQNPPLHTVQDPDCLQHRIDEHEFRLRALPLMVQAILQSQVLQAVIHQSDGKILSDQLVLEATELVDRMVAQGVWHEGARSAGPDHHSDTVLGGVIKVEKIEKTTSDHPVNIPQGNPA